MQGKGHALPFQDNFWKCKGSSRTCTVLGEHLFQRVIPNGGAGKEYSQCVDPVFGVTPAYLDTHVYYWKNLSAGEVKPFPPTQIVFVNQMASTVLSLHLPLSSQFTMEFWKRQYVFLRKEKLYSLYNSIQSLPQFCKVRYQRLCLEQEVSSDHTAVTLKVGMPYVAFDDARFRANMIKSVAVCLFTRVDLTRNTLPRFPCSVFHQRMILDGCLSCAALRAPVTNWHGSPSRICVTISSASGVSIEEGLFRLQHTSLEFYRLAWSQE